MAVESDPAAKLAEYAHPERLVTTGWLAERLGQPGLVVVESDEDVLLYETGHIPGAVKVDWHTSRASASPNCSARRASRATTPW
jgi:thiosulfate/3-mercaptopyruvate sulfurtransferase